MAETNSTTTPSIWGKIGSVLTDKALDLADSYAALKLGKPADQNQQTTPGTTAAPYVAPATVTAKNNTKLFLWIGGVVAALVLIVVLLRPRRGR